MKIADSMIFNSTSCMKQVYAQFHYLVFKRSSIAIFVKTKNWQENKRRHEPY